MNNPYDDDPYSDYDDYDDSHDYENISDWQKFYFKFDVNPYGSLSDWIKKMMEDLDGYKIPLLPEGFSPVSFPVNIEYPNTDKDNNPYQYLGTNVYNEGVWKYKFFFEDKLVNEYVNHLRSHAIHFLCQPHYYKGMFEILN